MNIKKSDLIRKILVVSAILALFFLVFAGSCEKEEKNDTCQTTKLEWDTCVKQKLATSDGDRAYAEQLCGPPPQCNQDNN